VGTDRDHQHRLAGALGEFAAAMYLNRRHERTALFGGRSKSAPRDQLALRPRMTTGRSAPNIIATSSSTSARSGGT